MKQYKMWIDGKWVDADSGKTFPVYNPATEEVIAELPLGGKTDVNKAVEAALRALRECAGHFKCQCAGYCGDGSPCINSGAGCCPPSVVCIG